MSGPRVSVIVPVRDRGDLLQRTLDGLAAQRFRDFEVIVVDDGSTDGSGDVAAQEGRVAVQVVRGPARGAVAARAAGVAAAAGDVLAFTDSDCVPDPAWLEAGVRAIDGGADVVSGRTESSAPRRLLERSLTAADDGLYPTCNVFYRRAAFERAGGFDATAHRALGFRPDARAKGLGFGEDTLLAWRVRRAGTATYAPDAVVRHAVLPPDLRDHFSRTLQGGAFPALVKSVPELRQSLLHGRVFLGSPTRVPLYLACLAVVLRMWWVAGGLIGVWLVVHAMRVARRDDRLKRKLLAYPVVVATDALTAAALVAGSVRARSVVL